MNSKAVGTLSEYKVITRLLELGFDVSIPIGDNSRYDIIIDHKGKLFRCQIKTGRRVNGGFDFHADSSYTQANSYRKEDYLGQIEFFISYLPNEELYVFFPCDSHKSGIVIRTEPTKNNQIKGINFYEDYILDKFASYLDADDGM